MTKLSRILAAFARMSDDLLIHPGERARFAVDLAAARLRLASGAPAAVRVRLQIDGHPARTLAAAYVDDPATDRSDVAQVLRQLADEIEAPQRARTPAGPGEADAEDSIR